jgi:opacity protein-like surface antigen
MNKPLWVVVILLACAVASGAQDTSKFDIFGGYSFVHSGPGLGLTSGDANGWEASAAYNWNKWLALKADVDGHYCCAQTMHNFLFGPQINLGHDKLRPYFHGLVGVSHGTSSPGFSDTVLGFALGGGVDLKWTDRISLRLVQADYLGTRYGDATQNNFRLSAGLVFHFGKK